MPRIYGLVEAEGRERHQYGFSTIAKAEGEKRRE
jgi:hypothetical protein